jgi:hypothetical protein
MSDGVIAYKWKSDLLKEGKRVSDLTNDELLASYEACEIMNVFWEVLDTEANRRIR